MDYAATCCHALCCPVLWIIIYIYMLFEGCDLPQCFSLLHVAVSSTYLHKHIHIHIHVDVHFHVCVVCVVWEGEEERRRGGGVVVVGGWVLCFSRLTPSAVSLSMNGAQQLHQETRINHTHRTHTTTHGDRQTHKVDRR